MVTYLDILNELAATASRNEKKLILGRYGMNDDLKTFFKLSLDPFINFYIKKIPKYLYDPESKLELRYAMEMLGELSSRRKTGTAAILYLTGILNSLTEDDGEIIKRIIAKDPKCGVAESTVNEIWPDLIPTFPVMKASPYDEKTIKNITFPAYSQTKIDGSRCQAVIEDGKVVMYSSNGRPFDLHDMFDAGLMEDFGDNVVLDGELVVVEQATGKLMDRKKGNGLINKAVKGTMSYEEAKMVHFILFDLIPLEDWKSGDCPLFYENRFKRLVLAEAGRHHNFSIVETKIVKSEKDAYDHFKEQYAKGEEGTILKDKRNIWEGKRSKTQLKFKGILTCDLLVIDVQEGTGKYEGQVGALVCRSGDNLLEVNVGTGLSDEHRKQAFDYWIGQIVEVAYNEKIMAKSKDAKMSLFLPRYLSRRFDKDNADTLENIA